MTRIFAGILAACIGVSVIVWHSSRGKVEREPVSTSSVPLRQKEEPPTPGASESPNLAANTRPGPAESQVIAAPQSVPAAPMAAPTTSELVQQIQGIAREITDVEQGIDQLKTAQLQLLHENAELTEQLKATREIAGHNAELADDILRRRRLSWLVTTQT